MSDLAGGIAKTLAVLNEMESDGAIGRYAIGGAVAAYLYLEPAFTADIDIFCILDAPGLNPLGPVLSWLEANGYSRFEKEVIVIEGWAVQIIPVFDELTRDALHEAIPIELDGIPTRIFTQEHLMAICLQTGRPKDVARLASFVSEFDLEGGPSRERFASVLERFGLAKKYERLKERLSDV